MVVLAHQVYGDRYEIDKVTYMPFRVYKGEDELKVRHAEVAMRYESTQILIKSAGTELWVFAINDVMPSPPQQFNLKLLSKGTILPSSVGLASSDQTPRPWHYLEAIRALCNTHLIDSSGDFVPFGQSLYSAKTGLLLHIVPSITKTGSLYIRLTKEATLLRPVHSKETRNIWLIPCGRQAHLVDTFAPASPTLARKFIAVVQGLYYFKIPYSKIVDTQWVEVSVNGNDFFWPQIYTVTRRYPNTSFNELARDDTFSTLVAQMNEVREPRLEIKLEPCLERTLAPTFSIPPPLPPPPPTPSAANAPTNTSLAAPIPSDAIYPTPNDHSPDRPPAPDATHMASDPWTIAEEDNDEVTVADFNYFDIPESQAEPIPKLEIEDAPMMEIVEPVKPPSLGARGAFAPIQLTNGIDTKYSTGGRYFTPHVTDEMEDITTITRVISASESDEDDYDDDDEDEDELESGCNSAMSEDEFFPDPWTLGSVGAGPADGGIKYDESRHYLELSRQFSKSLPRNREESNNEAMWSNILYTTTNIKHKPRDDLSLDTLQTLMAQIIWDEGLTSDEFGVSELEPAEDFVAKLLEPVFRSMRRVSMADICVRSMPISAIGTPRATSPVLPGADTARPATPRREEEPRFTLLSPPLYLVKRMDQFHKARAAILRFWKVFGLQPIGEKRDVMCIRINLISAKYPERGLGDFVQALKTVYEGCNLGKLEFPTAGLVKNGALPIIIDPDYTNPDTIGELFENVCAVLKRQLKQVDPQKKILITMIFPHSHRSSPIPLARGFLSLKSGFPNMRWMLVKENQMPQTDIACVESQYKLVRSALLIYNRWVTKTNNDMNAEQPCGAFELARLVPHSINIRYDVQPPVSIFDADPLMHVCYKITADRQWVAVSWSDQWASLTRVEVFRYAIEESQEEGKETALSTVFREIWTRTSTLCGKCTKQPPNCRWRVAIIKCGPMNVGEANVWTAVQETCEWSHDEAKISHSYLLSIPYGKPLCVRDNEVLFPHVFEEPTDDREPAQDSVIVSTLDETHGLVFESKLYELGSSTGAIATGVFLKPLLPPAKSGHQQLEFSLISGTGNAKQTMKQILGQYRRLASFSEHTSVSTNTTILPWHIAAVMKMDSALANI